MIWRWFFSFVCHEMGFGQLLVNPPSSPPWPYPGSLLDNIDPEMDKKTLVMIFTYLDCFETLKD